MRTLLQPNTTQDIERWLLPDPKAFNFSYKQRRFPGASPESIAYDRRYVALYHPERVWLVGWWNSYFGWVYYDMPTQLHTARPFHHPWLIVDELGDSPQKEEQRKPINNTERRNAFYAVIVTENDDPPTIDSYLPEGQEFGYPATYVNGTGPAATTLPYPSSPLTDALMALPIETVAGIAKRHAYDAILAWMQWAANWMHENAAFLVEDYAIDFNDAEDLLYAISALQLEAIMIQPEQIPTRSVR